MRNITKKLYLPKENPVTQMAYAHILVTEIRNASVLVS